MLNGVTYRGDGCVPRDAHTAPAPAVLNGVAYRGDGCFLASRIGAERAYGGAILLPAAAGIPASHPGGGVLAGTGALRLRDRAALVAPASLRGVLAGAGRCDCAGKLSDFAAKESPAGAFAVTILLGVNVDHVATLRQARNTLYPDPVEAAREALAAGADYITVHLREDRRHIQDHDVQGLIGMPQARVNLEMAATGEMLALAERWRPEDCCLVPERRQELTTEGGLDVCGQASALRKACRRLASAGVRVSLFVDPDETQLRAAAATGAPVVELHTGAYAEARETAAEELARIRQAARLAAELGLVVNAGHGLHYENTRPVAAIEEISELNIGHAIVAQAVFDGFSGAVRRMKRLMTAAREVQAAAGGS